MSWSHGLAPRTRRDEIYYRITLSSLCKRSLAEYGNYCFVLVLVASTSVSVP